MAIIVTHGRVADAVASMAAAAHLSASVTTSGHTTIVRLAGAADAADVDLLTELFDRVDADARRGGGATVQVDVRSLEVMSSPAFRTLLRWVEGIGELEPAERYLVRIVSD